VSRATRIRTNDRKQDDITEGRAVRPSDGANPECVGADAPNPLVSSRTGRFLGRNTLRGTACFAAPSTPQSDGHLRQRTTGADAAFPVAVHARSFTLMAATLRWYEQLGHGAPMVQSNLARLGVLR
jgi:hypothetical protein